MPFIFKSDKSAPRVAGLLGRSGLTSLAVCAVGGTDLALLRLAYVSRYTLLGSLIHGELRNYSFPDLPPEGALVVAGVGERELCPGLLGAASGGAVGASPPVN